VIIGPTASGKTALSLDLAEEIRGEIISGDSMQVYRHMDIGTAKIKAEEMRGIPHYLINIKDPDEPFSVADFQILAREKIREISSRGRIPILVGGTGLYIQAVIDPYEFTPQEGVAEYRRKLFHLAAEDNGTEKLHKMLLGVDQEAAAKIHLHDVKRIVRALEYYHITGKKISDNTRAKEGGESRYNLVMNGLAMNRTELYKRIERRVELMMQEGFLREVKDLLAKGYKPTLPSMQGLGYRQLCSYLEGEYDLRTAVELIKRDTRRFAKRQLTWFRRDPRIIWFDLDKNDRHEILFKIVSEIGRTIRTNVE
jgi:tRNA dimethylallyltransferase